MAACANPHSINLDQPLSEIPPTVLLRPLSPPPSWNHQKSSFAEIFGELLLKEHPQPPESLCSSAFSSTAASDSSSSSSSSADATDTEADGDANKSLGSESSDAETEEMMRDFGIEERPHFFRHSFPRISRMTRAAAFPPPISCIGRSGKPWVLFKSYRENGRFILKEIRIPTQEFMHACRKDGRLKLHIIQSDDEIPYDDDNEDEEDEYDEEEEKTEEEVEDDTEN